MHPLLGRVGFQGGMTQVVQLLFSPLLPSQPCWSEYLATRIEQNMVVSCTCPISECRAQPTAAFICSIISSEEIIAKVK